MNIATLRMIMRHICCIIVAMFLGAFAFAGEPSFIIPEFNCSTSSEQACFEEAAKELHLHYKDIAAEAIKNSKSMQEYYKNYGSLVGAGTFLKDEETQITLQAVPALLHQGKKTPYVFIYVHGLWGNSWEQFFYMMKNDYMAGMNVLNIQLPGHGADGKNGRKVSYKDWIKSYDNALKMAKYFGHKAVVVGHSTGGLISFYAAEKEPDFVKGMILMEPAFKVKARWKAVTCGLGDVLPEAGKMNKIARIFGMYFDTEHPIYLNLGCDVARLGQYVRNFISQKYKSSKPLAWEEIFKKASVPVFLFNNSNDNIVSSRVNKKLSQNYTGPEIVTVDYTGKVKHGYATAILGRDTDGGKGYYQFVYKNFGIRNMSVFNRIQRLKTHVKHFTIIQELLKDNPTMNPLEYENQLNLSILNFITTAERSEPYYLAFNPKFAAVIQDMTEYRKYDMELRIHMRIINDEVTAGVERSSFADLFTFINLSKYSEKNWVLRGSLLESDEDLKSRLSKFSNKSVIYLKELLLKMLNQKERAQEYRLVNEVEIEMNEKQLSDLGFTKEYWLAVQ